MQRPRLWCAVACLAIAAVAQDPAQGGKGGADAARADLEQVLATWLEARWDDPERIEPAVQAVLDAESGLPWLGAQLRAAAPLDASKRGTGLRRLTTHVLLGFVDRRKAGGMIFRGQYDPLAVLQPVAGEELFALLLDPPAWFADTRRVDLVPALADLQPRPPAPPVVEGIVALIEDREREPADLRFALSCLVWQWGREEFVEAELLRLRRASAEGDAEDRILFLRRIADVHYRIRDYERAADASRALQAMASSAGIPLTPTDWYWAACYHALADRPEEGFAALERCADLQASASVDASLKLPRALFEGDPEIASLRADPRFAALLARAFPPDPERRDR